MPYDRPYEDSKRIRLTGPVTVKSLSPHRALQASEEQPASEAQRYGSSGTQEAEQSRSAERRETSYSRR